MSHGDRHQTHELADDDNELIRLPPRHDRILKGNPYCSKLVETRASWISGVGIRSEHDWLNAGHRHVTCHQDAEDPILDKRSWITWTLLNCNGRAKPRCSTIVVGSRGAVQKHSINVQCQAFLLAQS